MQCPQCGRSNPPGSRFCNGCGAPIVDTVAAVAPSRLALPLSYTPRHLAEKILTSRSAIEGERKQVTVLFCDLAKSTELAERLGEDVMHRLLDRFFDVTLGEVHRYEGTVNQFLGDGFMALFGAPLAHEDHARRAVLAALGLERALREQRAAFRLPDDVELAVRMGMNTGPVVVGKIGDNLRMDYTAVGDTTNLAARLQQLAEPGAIHLSEATYRLVAPYVDCKALGERTVKGKSEPVTVYRLAGARARPEPSQPPHRAVVSPLVGRDADLDALVAHVEGLAGGSGAVVALVGEAGLGKSRLMAEARRRTAGRDLLWLEGRGRSLGQTIAFWPFVEILRAAAGIEEDDGDAASWTRLERRVREAAPEEATDILPYLATLVGLEVRGDLAARLRHLDGQAVRRQILVASRRFFGRLARERPLVVVFEDLHWIDASSLELLEHLLPLVTSAPMLVVVAARPDVAAPLDRFRESATRTVASHYVERRLAPLGEADGTRLLQNLLATALPAGLAHSILGRTGGNPLFLEEVVRALIDMRGVVEIDGRWQVAPDVQQLAIPDTLQGVILARIDRLDDELKMLLKVASVIGRGFLYRVLSAVAAAGEHLDRQLGELQQGDLVRERRRVPELEYVFKHALVQEATYQTILLDRRRRLHREVAECLESLFPDRLEELAGVLAYHYSRAEEWSRAQAYLLEAGDQAGRIAADAEALANYRQALDAYARAFGDRWDPIERATLERKIGDALFRRGDHDGALDQMGRALRLLGVSDPTSQWGVRRGIAREILRQAAHRLLPRGFLAPETNTLAPAVAEECRVYEIRAWMNYFLAPERVVLDSLRLLNVSERRGNARGVAEGLAFAGMICGSIGLPTLARWYHRRAVAHAERFDDPQARGIAWFGLGYHDHLCRGDSESALAHLRRAARIFREAGELRGWSGPTTMAAVALVQRGQLRASLAESRELIQTGQDGGDRLMWGWGAMARGYALLSTGDVTGAIASLREAAGLFEFIPAPGLVVEALGFLGQCHVRRGGLAEAQAVLDESERLIARHRLRDHQVASTLIGRASVCLAIAESAHGPARAKAFDRARQTCAALLRLTGITRPAYPPACRLRGTVEWLCGRRPRAEKWWSRGVAAAEAMGHRYDLACAYLERGRRTGRRRDLDDADRIFAEIGVAGDR